MAKKLYFVQISYYVVAEDETDAQYTAVDHTAVTVDEIIEVDSLDEVVPEWVDAIPFGEPDLKTCAEYFEDSEDDNAVPNEALPDPLFPEL